MNKFSKEIDWLVRDKYKGKRREEKIEKDLERLKRGEPIAYVVGWIPFLGCQIDLSFKPLIPRPETEYWVEKVIVEFQNKKNLKVLDLFAGSGCIGLTFLKKVPGSFVDFGEKESDQIKQIRKNVKINKVEKGRVKVIETNIFSNIKEKYDLILANPPYIPSEKIKTVQTSVLKYEPRTALFGGKDGLIFIKKFLAESKVHLKPGGKIFLEFGQGQKRAIEKLAKENRFGKREFWPDQYGRPRVAVLEV